MKTLKGKKRMISMDNKLSEKEREEIKNDVVIRGLDAKEENVEKQVREVLEEKIEIKVEI
jgi:hypothetical protein